MRCYIDRLPPLILGIESENDARKLIIDVTTWRAEFPEMWFEILVELPGQPGIQYPAPTTLEGNDLMWVISDEFTAATGEGKYEVLGHSGETLKRTGAQTFTVLESAIDISVAGVPDVSKPWVEQVLAARECIFNAQAITQEQAEAAAQSADAAQEAANNAKKAVDDAVENIIRATEQANGAAGAANGAADAANGAANGANGAADAAKVAADAANDAAVAANGAADAAKVAAENVKDGGYYEPFVSGDGWLAWTPSEAGMPVPSAVCIRGPVGAPGTNGETPTITSKKTDGVTTIQFKTSSTVYDVQIKDGERGPEGPKGQQGPQGDAGDTPEIIQPAAGSTPIVATDSADRPLRGLTVYGQTTQDGMPSEDAPVEMHSVGDAGEVTVSVLAGLPEGGTDRIAIIRQPRGVTAAVDSAATFRVFAIGRGLTYQWEYMPTTSTTWRNNTFPGNDTDTLTFSAKAYHDGYKYRCLITDASGNTVRTDEVTLTIGKASGSSDGAADTQTAAISITDGLRGVPVTGSAATYTDADGQGWIADTIEYDAQTGTAQLVRRVGRVTFNGNAGEEWTLDTQNNPYLAIAVQGKAPVGGLCTHYSRAEIEPGTSQTGFSAAASRDKIVFRPADFATITVDAWRARLNASPVTVLYALAVPEATPITGDELTALAQLRSRYPATTIYNDAGAQMAARYVADTKNYVDNADAEIAKAVIGVDERVDAAMENIADAGKRADAAQTKAGENERNIGLLKSDIETKADNAEFNATLEELTAEVMCSRNVFDDSEYVGDTMPDYTQVADKTFLGNFKYLKLGTPYFVQVEYTDGTKGNVQLVWQYIYADGTVSSKYSLGTSNIAEKDVKGFSISRTAGYTNTDDGKQIAHVWMTSGSNVYEPYKVSVKSERLENLEKDIGNAMISSNYMVQKNLLTDENITDNLQIQPYTTVADENYCSAYIPVKTGQTLYANYPLGTFVAWLCKDDKTKISWVTINYSNEGASRNTGYTVETEDVEYIRLYWNKTRSGHHAYGTSTFDLFFSTEPIRFKCSDKQFDESYIPEFNTGRLNNWWYLKSGDSLGDSLTGQGFFQSWTKRYFGLNSFANHGVGGSKLSGADIDSTRPSMWKDERINTLSATADFITVLGGQNDGNVAIGDISKSNYDTDTYVGALNTIIDKIYDHCKQGVIIILCTPFYVPLEGDNGERFKILGDAVRELSKLRGLPVADFGGLCTADKKTADLYWGTDRTHPNENFYRDKIAPILISTMESIKPINWENVNYYD